MPPPSSSLERGFAKLEKKQRDALTTVVVVAAAVVVLKRKALLVVVVVGISDGDILFVPTLFPRAREKKRNRGDFFLSETLKEKDEEGKSSRPPRLHSDWKIKEK